VNGIRARQAQFCDWLARDQPDVVCLQELKAEPGQIPEPCKAMGSVEFSKFLLKEAKVAVSPGIGFGQYGDEFVRFALIENEHRTRQAVRTIRRALGKSPD